MRLGILTPSNGMMYSEADTAQKAMLIRTAYWMQKTFGDEGEIKLLTTNRAYIPQARAILLKAAVESECDWCLWLDDDMIPPPDMVERLYLHTKGGRKVVGGLASRKIVPAEPVAFQYLPGQGLRPMSSCDLTEDKGLVEVDSTGMANVLIHTSVMAQVNQASNGLPFQFIVGYNAEDLHFFNIARAIGHKFYIDCTIRVGHQGTKLYEV